MESPKPKSSLLTALGIEVVVIVVLTILIVSALNYFNVISLPQASILPHENANKAPAVTAINQCAPLPKGAVTKVISPTSSVSAALAAYSGTWKGSWNPQYRSVLIIRDITPKYATVGYFVNGVRVLAAMQFSIDESNRLIAPNNLMTYEMKQDGIHGSILYRSGAVASTVVMTRCTP
ncbi:MAG TPA: hypothetical protein VG965_02235 [Patescibacteria group bacterium]|nr:hypothetical protein [Patescibacteria group bacterium]